MPGAKINTNSKYKVELKVAKLIVIAFTSHCYKTLAVDHSKHFFQHQNMHAQQNS